jgi:hypothetical protein
VVGSTGRKKGRVQAVTPKSKHFAQAIRFRPKPGPTQRTWSINSVVGAVMPAKEKLKPCGIVEMRYVSRRSSAAGNEMVVAPEDSGYSSRRTSSAPLSSLIETTRVTSGPGLKTSKRSSSLNKARRPSAVSSGPIRLLHPDVPRR